MTIADWASLATVLLCLEAFIMGLVSLIVAYGLGRGLSYVLRELPRLLGQVRGFGAKLQGGAARVSGSVVRPAFRAAELVAYARGLWRGVRRLTE